MPLKWQATKSISNKMKTEMALGLAGMSGLPAAWKQREWLFHLALYLRHSKNVQISLLSSMNQFFVPDRLAEPCSILSGKFSFFFFFCLFWCYWVLFIFNKLLIILNYTLRKKNWYFLKWNNFSCLIRYDFFLYIFFCIYNLHDKTKIRIH